MTVESMMGSVVPLLFMNVATSLCASEKAAGLGLGSAMLE
jgi:hypothetical protein